MITNLNFQQLQAIRRNFPNHPIIGQLLDTIDDRERAARDFVEAYEKLAGEVPAPLWDVKRRLGL